MISPIGDVQIRNGDDATRLDDFASEASPIGPRK
jgi:hypothetical protein